MEAALLPTWVTAEFVNTDKAARLRVRCRRCGDQYELYGMVPYSIGALAMLLGNFMDEHSRCRAILH